MTTLTDEAKLRFQAFAAINALDRETITDTLLEYSNTLAVEDRRGATLMVHFFMRSCRALRRVAQQRPKPPTRKDDDG